MKIKLLGLGIFAIGILAFGFQAAFANEFRSNTNITVAASEFIEGDLFASGEVIIIEGTVNGDVFAAGQTILVKGVVNGDLYAATESLEVSGTIRDDVLFAARTANFITANVGGSTIMLAETVILDSESKIGGSLLFAIKTLAANGQINRGITGSAENVTINSSVAQNIRVSTSNLKFGPQANVSGDVLYHSPNQAVVEEGATLKGNVEQKIRETGNSTAGFIKFFKAFIVWSYLSSIFTGLVLLFLFKRPLQLVAEQIKKSLAANFGWGALILLLFLPAFTLLLVTTIGIPLALLLAISFGAALYIGKIVVSLAVGQWLLAKFADQRAPNRYTAFVVGLSLYYLLKLLPLVNVFAILAVAVIGVGAIALSVKNSLIIRKAKK